MGWYLQMAFDSEPTATALQVTMKFDPTDQMTNP